MLRRFAGGFFQSLCSSTVLKILCKWYFGFCRRSRTPIPHGVEQQECIRGIGSNCDAEADLRFLFTLIRRGAENVPRGDPGRVPNGSLSEANIYFFMGNLEAAEGYRSVSQELRNLGFRIGASQAEVNLAETLPHLDQPGSIGLLDGEVERNFRSMKAIPSLIEALRVRGEVLLRLHRSSEARLRFVKLWNLRKARASSVRNNPSRTCWNGSKPPTPPPEEGALSSANTKWMKNSTSQQT